MNILNEIPKKNSELAWRVIDKEAVIIPLDEQTQDSEKINFLNETGTRIWELINGKNNIKEIGVKICQEYDIGQEEAGREVMSFVKKLLDKNLIKI